MAKASKQIVTQSLVPNKHPLTFAQLPTSEGTLPNVNEGICHRLFTFAVPSTYRRCHEKISCVEFCVIILLHEWVDRGQMDQL